MCGGHHSVLSLHEPGPRHLPPLAGLGSLALQIVQSVSSRVEGFVASAPLPLQPQHFCWSPSRCTPAVAVGAGTATASSATFCDLQEQHPHFWEIRAELLEQVREEWVDNPHRCPLLHRFHAPAPGQVSVTLSLQHVPHSHHQSGLRTHCAHVVSWFSSPTSRWVSPSRRQLSVIMPIGLIPPNQELCQTEEHKVKDASAIMALQPMDPDHITGLALVRDCLLQQNGPGHLDLRLTARLSLAQSPSGNYCSLGKRPALQQEFDMRVGHWSTRQRRLALSWKRSLRFSDLGNRQSIGKIYLGRHNGDLRHSNSCSLHQHRQSSCTACLTRRSSGRLFAKFFDFRIHHHRPPHEKTTTNKHTIRRASTRLDSAVGWEGHTSVARLKCILIPKEDRDTGVSPFFKL